MKVLEYITALMPTFNKARLDETAQCVSNFLQREVQDLLRRKPRDSQTNNTNLLSETVINDLNSIIEPPENETTIDAIDQYDSDTHISDENEDNDEQVTTILDNSITQLKKVACDESKNSKTTEKNTHKSASYENNDTKCCKTCKVKPSSKRKHDMIRCSLCAHWFHEACVGIQKNEPVGIWMCETCRCIPASVKDDISGMKSEINGLKECTQNILKAVLEMSKKVENNFGSINDLVTALLRQINGKDLVITESLEQLQTSTDTLKSSLDQKACKITNQTAAILEKVKTQGENIKTITKSNPNIHRPDSNKPKDTNQNVITEGRNSAEIQTNTSERKKFKKPKPKAKHQNTSKQNNQNNQSAEKIPQSLNVDEAKDYIDLTKGTEKNIKQTTLLVGSSILKGVQTKDLNSDTAVRSFSGATTVSLKEKLQEYDIQKCKTVILHVGGNDADDEDSLETFCDNYIELLESLACDDRLLIVSGLLPRKSVDLEPYNGTLKILMC